MKTLIIRNSNYELKKKTYYEISFVLDDGLKNKLKKLESSFSLIIYLNDMINPDINIGVNKFTNCTMKHDFTIISKEKLFYNMSELANIRTDILDEFIEENN